ncbi:MAG: hypothetical protein ACR2JH_09930 [Solirubrobacteraceae bacterium]
MRRGRLLAAIGSGLMLAAGAAASSASTAASSDPLCLGSYGSLPARHGARLRFGVDPGLAGSVGGAQLPAVPDAPVRDLAAVRHLRPSGKVMVVRLNRLFWSDGAAGIASFQRLAAWYARAGLDVEVQVRYHPAPGEAGDIAGWDRYVRQVVHAFGGNRHVVAMTITNEVNVTFSPNTSDGYYQGAEDALISGIEAAHDQARREKFTQLRFGFTYAYRFAPTQDAAFFAYLAAHGGTRLSRALGFIGLDFYPGSVFPPVMLPGDSYRAELAQAAGVLRRCLVPRAGIDSRVPIWITENGVPTGILSESQQASALRELVQAASDLSGTYGISDYRWFNLRDSVTGGVTGLIGATFATDGLLRSDYTPKPAFAAYRTLIGKLGANARARPRRRSAHHHHR